MHMADSLVSPVVGGLMWAVSAGTLAVAVAKIARKPKSESGEVFDDAGRTSAQSINSSLSKNEVFDEKKIPLMGILGAFVFAAQMLNFTIPGTGSSGHICGGILLAGLLGPWAAIITLASVLIIQCLFFADGGLLAYGCNVFNMGITGAVLAYSLIWRPLTKHSMSKGRITLASIVSCMAGLEAGAFCVVLETKASGITALPFGAFVGLMLPIHLAIGFVEGIATAAVLCFVLQARPELLTSTEKGEKLQATVRIGKVAAVFALIAVIFAAGISLVASKHPDGLEWAISNVTGSTELEESNAAQKAASAIRAKTAILPDYGFKTTAKPGKAGEMAGTSISGLAGGAFTLILAGLIAVVLKIGRAHV
jgi:cobalt/nickel transport system permease protein